MHFQNWKDAKVVREPPMDDGSADHDGLAPRAHAAFAGAGSEGIQARGVSSVDAKVFLALRTRLPSPLPWLPLPVARLENVTPALPTEADRGT